MKRLIAIISLVSTIILFATSSYAKCNDDRIHVTLLHFNDVYEITPVSGGKEGGLARVATLRKELLKKNPNTITLLGGDLFSPSAMGTAKVDGITLAGKQMVDVLNALELDYATFGNHEFDIKEEQFNERMKETKFIWISSNVFDVHGKPYPGVKKDLLLSIKGKKSCKAFDLGIFGVTLTANNPHYVSYTDPMKTAEAKVKELDGNVDFLIALTHQFLHEDEALLQQQPKIDLLLGGHEHINYQQWRGSNLSPLLKGEANVRTVYVVDLFFDPKTKKTEIKPQLIRINSSIKEDSEVKAVVDKWVKVVFDAFREQGLNPEEIVTTTTEPLDGLESSVRYRSTNLTKLVAESMLISYSEADLSLFNSGSIRIDDILPAGKITVYDIIRVLPFGGMNQLVVMKGSLLKKVLIQGEKNVGAGGYLQSANTSKSNSGNWLVNGVPIDEQKKYKIAITDFLMTGKEANLNYLTPANPDVTVINDGKGTDIRQLVIQELRQKGIEAEGTK